MNVGSLSNALQVQQSLAAGVLDGLQPGNGAPDAPAEGAGSGLNPTDVVELSPEALAAHQASGSGENAQA